MSFPMITYSTELNKEGSVKSNEDQKVGMVYVLRIEDTSDCIAAFTWRPEGRRKVGRPRTTWRRTVLLRKKGMIEVEFLEPS